MAPPPLLLLLLPTVPAADPAEDSDGSDREGPPGEAAEPSPPLGFPGNKAPAAAGWVVVPPDQVKVPAPSSTGPKEVLTYTAVVLLAGCAGGRGAGGTPVPARREEERRGAGGLGGLGGGAPAASARLRGTPGGGVVDLQRPGGEVQGLGGSSARQAPGHGLDRGGGRHRSRLGGDTAPWWSWRPGAGHVGSAPGG
jgi:hypothetical protein